jgi:NADH dehydrogenase
MANQVQTDPPSRRGAAHGGTLILGGGFAGAHIARCLGKRGATIISPESAMLYAPILPEVAAGAIEARHVTVPLRVMCPHAEVLLGWATALDEDTRIVTVETEGGEIEVSYDNLVVALGAVASWLPIPGLAQHALGFKNLADAIHLREHVLHQLDTAATDPGHAARHLAFVFVGAGYAGVEALAEVRDLVRDALRHHPALRDIPQRWVLVDLAPRILPEAPGGLGDYAAKQLRKRGAELRLSTTVTSVEEHAVDLSDGTRIETNTVVWTAGVKPSGALAGLGLPLDQRGRVVVDPLLRVEGRSNVWALGDCAAVPNQATPDRLDPPTCQHALRQARHLAKNLRAEPTPYRYRSIGQGATLGRDKGVANFLGRLNFKGTVGSIASRWYHVRQIPIFSRRLRILTDGTLSFLFGRDMATLGLLERSHATAPVVAVDLHDGGPPHSDIPDQLVHTSTRSEGDRA